MTIVVVMAVNIKSTFLLSKKVRMLKELNNLNNINELMQRRLVPWPAHAIGPPKCEINDKTRTWES